MLYPMRWATCILLDIVRPHHFLDSVSPRGHRMNEHAKPIRRMVRWTICLSAIGLLGLHGSTLLIDRHTESEPLALQTDHPTDCGQSQSAIQSNQVTHANSAKNIKLLQWNIFMLPLPVGYAHDPACRSKQIREQLINSGADIIALNASFNRLHVVKNISIPLKARYPHQMVSLPESQGKRKVNGGLSLLSKYPISSQHHEAFKSCRGSDCLSNKGFLHAVLNVDRQRKLNVIVTHLNSGLGQANQDVRLEQVAQLNAYLKKNKDIAQWPAVMLGDLNANGIRHNTYRMPPKTDELTDYGSLMKALGNTCSACKSDRCRSSCSRYPADTMRDQQGQWPFTPASTGKLNSLNCVGPTLTTCVDFNDLKYWPARQRFDYILALAPPQKAPKRTIKISQTKFHHLKDSPCDGQYLSDHKALTATLSFQ